MKRNILKATILLLGLTPSLLACNPQTSISVPDIDLTEDVVANTHIKLEDGLFEKLMKNTPSKAFDSSSDYLDFQRDGVERMLTASDCSTQAKADEKKGDVFTNYVDGDTTHFTTYNGAYSVKVRYLGVDTPESTSEIEVWGASASKFNKSRLQKAKHIIVQSAGCAKTGKLVPADLDGYQRSLAYVWYTDVDNPTQNDFRNLNLELVFEGYSLFSGTIKDMSEMDDKGNIIDSSFFQAFSRANSIAVAMKKHMFSDNVDPNYYYGKPVPLGLDKLYEAPISGKDVYSPLCDNYTKYTFEGVVTCKVGEAFYIQDTIGGKPYGLYVFTMRHYEPVEVGNRIRVSGVLDFYNGYYELKGVSYSHFNHQEGDIELISKNNKVEPVAVNIADLYNNTYQSVYVTIKDDKKQKDAPVYFNSGEFTSSGELRNNNYGGSEEVNQFNQAHPFFNTNDSVVVFGKVGSDMSAGENSSRSPFIRFDIPSDVRFQGGYTYYEKELPSGTWSEANVIEKANVASYRYFSGGTNYYVPGEPVISYELNEKARSSEDPTADYTGASGTCFKTVYKRKKLDSVSGICHQYYTSSGALRQTLTITNRDDIKGITELD